jgi:putative YphP/YqiW family bacilliredoxin
MPETYFSTPLCRVVSGDTAMMPSMYDREAVKPMWEELNRVGIESLTTADDVTAALTAPAGSVLLLINSVCGCAAGGARPGVMLALQHTVIPDRSVTVFAGVDRDATEQARALLGNIPPSSPFIALFKDGKLVHVLQRSHIEMMNAGMIAQNLTEAFDHYCSAEGPSISAEEFNKICPVQQCGSTIPLA